MHIKKNLDQLYSIHRTELTDLEQESVENSSIDFKSMDLSKDAS